MSNAVEWELPCWPPDVNESSVLFTPLDGVIRFGLAAIKNVGTQAMESILQERKERPFDSLLDFCRRVDLRVCNKRVIESLIQGGAFDALPGHRAQLLAMLDETVEAAVKWRKEREDLQIQLFDFVETPHWEIDYPEVQRLSSAEQLELERELLGLYLSGHPLDDYEQALEQEGIDKLMELEEAPDEKKTVVAGMVVSIKAITTKQGKAMAFMELEDQIERCEVVLFPEVWRRSSRHISKGALLALRATVQQQDEGFKLLADEVAPLSAQSLQELRRGLARGGRAAADGRAGRTAPARKSPAAPPSGAAQQAPPSGAAADKPAAPEGEPKTSAGQRVFVKITAAAENARLLEQLKALLEQHNGPVPTVLFYERTGKLLELSERYRIRPSPELFREMETVLGPNTVRIR